MATQFLTTIAVGAGTIVASDRAYKTFYGGNQSQEENSKTKDLEEDAHIYSILCTIGAGWYAHQVFGYDSMSTIFSLVTIGMISAVAYKKFDPDLKKLPEFAGKHFFTIIGASIGALLPYVSSQDVPFSISISFAVIGAHLIPVLPKKLLCNWHSRLDESKIVNPDQSAVTLICSESTNSSWSDHAQMVIESVKETGYVMQIAHFCNDGLVHFSTIPATHLRYNKELGHSATYVKPAAQIQAMVDKISQETRTQQPFCVRGISAIFSSGHNCITWALKKLQEINIYPISTSWNPFATVPSGYMHQRKV